jgi:hypothetical protein
LFWTAVWTSHYMGTCLLSLFLSLSSYLSATVIPHARTPPHLKTIKPLLKTTNDIL